MGSDDFDRFLWFSILLHMITSSTLLVLRLIDPTYYHPTIYKGTVNDPISFPSFPYTRFLPLGRTSPLCHSRSYHRRCVATRMSAFLFLGGISGIALAVRGHIGVSVSVTDRRYFTLPSSSSILTTLSPSPFHTQFDDILVDYHYPVNEVSSARRSLGSSQQRQRLG
jgi:hypothetical protein